MYALLCKKLVANVNPRLYSVLIHYRPNIKSNMYEMFLSLKKLDVAVFLRFTYILTQDPSFIEIQSFKWRPNIKNRLPLR